MQHVSRNFHVFSFSVLAFIGLVMTSLQETVGNEILNRTNPKEVSMRATVRTSIQGNSPSLLVLNLPLPSSVPYQDVKSTQTSCSRNGNYQILAYPETSQQYASATFQNPSNNVEISATYNVVLYDISVDFSKISTIYPYDQNSSIYKTYTGSSGDIVDPTNPEIRRISESLWRQSNSILDYARRCYSYVAENYKYLNPNTGIHPLNKILRDGGGDCGNLTSIYVSLLRCRNIPARHLVGVRPNGTYHVWADFYLERYGWIPVDVTYKMQNKNGNFFGVVDASDVPVILSLGVNLTVNAIDQNRIIRTKTPLMQDFTHWNWYTSPIGKLDHNYQVENLW